MASETLRNTWAAVLGAAGAPVAVIGVAAVAALPAAVGLSLGWSLLTGAAVGAGLVATHRWQSSRHRRAVSDRLRLVSEAVDCLVYEWHVGTGRVERSAGLFGLTGYRPDEVPQTAEWWRTLIHPDDLAGLPKLGDTDCLVTEYRVRHKSGRWVHVMDRSVVRRGPDGKVVRLVGSTVDISDRVRSEERYRGLVRSNAIGTVYGDETGRLFEPNDEFLRIVGYTRADADAGLLDWVRMTPPELAARDALAVEEMRATGIVKPYEKLFVQKNGARVAVLIGASAVGASDGAQTCATFVIDRTPQVEAERARAESEQRLSRFAEANLIGMVFCDTGGGGRIHEANGEFLRIVGRTRAELDTGLGWRDFTPPEYLALDEQVIEQTFAAGRLSCAPYEKQYVRPDGSRVPVLVGFALLAAGSTSAIAFVMDLTDRHDRERALQSAIATARRAQETAEAASAAKDRLLAVLSHELRTPLTPVLAAVDMLENEPGVDDGTRSQLAMIRRNVELEARLIDDLLDLTRVARGKLSLELVTTDLSAVTAAAIETCRPDAVGQGQSLALSLAPDLAVRGDPARLQQVVWNLVQNAVKFSRRGGHIGVTTYRQDVHAVLEVRDEGAGISPDVLPRIFEPFEQGEEGVHRKYGGLGLGLAISRTLTQLHGGTISAVSAGPGLGSTFTVRVPVIDSAVSQAAAVTPPAVGVAIGKGLTLLLVEDHADSARAMSRLLGLDGFAVELADGVAAAVDAASRRRFDVLVSDLGLPDGTGIDVLRQLGDRRPPAAVCISGFGADRDIRETLAAGFGAHLTKPVSPARLREAIGRLVSATS